MTKNKNLVTVSVRSTKEQLLKQYGKKIEWLPKGAHVWADYRVWVSQKQEASPESESSVQTHVCNSG